MVNPTKDGLSVNYQGFHFSTKSKLENFMCVETHSRLGRHFYWETHKCCVCTQFCYLLMAFNVRCHTMGYIYRSRLTLTIPILRWGAKPQIMENKYFRLPQHTQKRVTTLSRIEIFWWVVGAEGSEFWNTP